MSKTYEFWKYAEEATLWVCSAKNEEERQVILDLARTWTLAALIERNAWVESPPVAA